MSDVLEQIKREISARDRGAAPAGGRGRPARGCDRRAERLAAGAEHAALGTRARKHGSPRGRRRRSAPRGQTKGLILKHLGENPGSTAGDIAKALDLNRNSVATRLAQMAKAGEIAKAKRGYAVAG